jgi:hypothetical protein
LRRFRCQICGAGYLQRAHANKHVVSSHPADAAQAGRSLAGLVIKLSNEDARRSQVEGSDGFGARTAANTPNAAVSAAASSVGISHRRQSPLHQATYVVQYAPRGPPQHVVYASTSQGVSHHPVHTVAVAGLPPVSDFRGQMRAPASSAIENQGSPPLPRHASYMPHPPGKY